MKKKIEAWALGKDPTKRKAVAAVLRAAIKVAEEESPYFSDEDGCIWKARPSSLKRAVRQLLSQREKK